MNTPGIRIRDKEQAVFYVRKLHRHAWKTESGVMCKPPLLVFVTECPDQPAPPALDSRQDGS